MKTIFTYWLILFILTDAVAQFCVAKPGDKIPTDFHNYQRSSILTHNNEVDTVIIYPIIGVNGAGQPAIDLHTLSTILEESNFQFNQAGVHFKLCGAPLFLQNKEMSYFNIEDSQKIQAKYGQLGVVNVYIPHFFYVENVVGTHSPICGVSTFPEDEEEIRMIVINSDCIGEPFVLTHELGHYYGLLHTHENSLGSELVRRVNCNVTGDLMCDTPADPTLSHLNVKDCEYVGSRQDGEGKDYLPQVTNFMSYSPIDCKSTFTEEQFKRINYVQKNFYSNYVVECDLPDFEIVHYDFPKSLKVNEEINFSLTIQNNGAPVDVPVRVLIYVTDVKLTKKAILKDYEIKLNKALLNIQEHTIVIPNLLAEEKQILHIEVDPNHNFRETNKRNNLEKSDIFFGTNEKFVSIYPSPTSGELNFVVNDIPNIGQISIRYFNFSGKLVKETLTRKEFKNFQFTDNLEELPSGIYFMTISVNGLLYMEKKIIKM